MGHRNVRIDVDELLSAVERDDNLGFCLACGAENGNCEPDARKLRCEACGEFRVYGAEQIMFMQIG